MPVNKVVYNGTILVDLTNDTVTADKLLEGITAHSKDGTMITGTMKSGGGGADEYDIDIDSVLIHGFNGITYSDNGITAAEVETYDVQNGRVNQVLKLSNGKAYRLSFLTTEDYIAKQLYYYEDVSEINGPGVFITHRSVARTPVTTILEDGSIQTMYEVIHRGVTYREYVTTEYVAPQYGVNIDSDPYAPVSMTTRRVELITE